MPDSSYLVNFPSSGVESLPTGNSHIDFVRGIANLPDGSIKTLVNSLIKPDKLRSIFTHCSQNATLIAFDGNKVVYRGLVPKGSFNLNSFSFNYIVITTTIATDVFLVCSTDPAPVGGTNTYTVYTAPSLPTSIIEGEKTDVSTVAAKLIAASTPINKAVTIKVRSLGTGSYISLGDSSNQRYRLTSVGDAQDVDWIDDLSKVYVLTDVGNTGELEWIGG